jgi:hypothetical protein
MPCFFIFLRRRSYEASQTINTLWPKKVHMVKSLNIDKINGIAVIEINRDELTNIVDSVYHMTEKVKRDLLENLPSNKENRTRVDNFNALKEGLRKVRESLN